MAARFLSVKVRTRHVIPARRADSLAAPRTERLRADRTIVRSVRRHRACFRLSPFGFVRFADSPQGKPAFAAFPRAVPNGSGRCPVCASPHRVLRPLLRLRTSGAEPYNTTPLAGGREPLRSARPLRVRAGPELQLSSSPGMPRPPEEVRFRSRCIGTPDSTNRSEKPLAQRYN